MTGQREHEARAEQDVPIRLYRFKGQNRWRWAARLPTTPVEGYGATPDEALQNLVDGLDTDCLAALLRTAEAKP